jgi:ppGpp synthetase/RelA/SpoT-type nucleotidyltranferase
VDIDYELLREKVKEYDETYSGYCQYAEFIRSVLKAACHRIASCAIVEARAKAKASYAEKVVRKQEKFKDPAYSFTDMCGARVITQVEEEKQLICDYIRKNFMVDWANTEDVKLRLKENEFGYLSVHYVVQIPDGLSQMEGIPIPCEVKVGPQGFKAEIQVRTMLEHVWANTLHDRLYKVSIQVPSSLKREAAAIASAMETADARFARLSSEIDSYLSSLSTYMDSDTMEKEISIIEATLQYESDPHCRSELALRLGRMARMADNLDAAIQHLTPLVSNPPTPSEAPICFELGQALCMRNQDKPESPEFKRGQKLLSDVVTHQPAQNDVEIPAGRKLRGEAASQLGWSYSLQRNQELQARNCYREALKLDAANPYHLAAYLEYEAFCRRDYSFVQVMRSTVEQAISVCIRHAHVGIEIQRAHFTIGRLRLLLGDSEAALLAYTQAMQMVLAPKSTIPATVFEEELEFLNRINVGMELPQEHEWVKMMMELAQTIKKPAAADAAFNDEFKFALIIVGGAAAMEKSEVPRYASVVHTVLKYCDGLVLAGGTKSGIPGLVGEQALRLKDEQNKQFTLIGYIPNSLPADAPVDERYEIRKTCGAKISPREVLQSWSDLLKSGIRPDKVRILGINGGPLAALEYRLALVLGARVAILAGSGREADKLLADPDWSEHPNLIPISRQIQDEPTLRAFVRPGTLPVSRAKLDELAKVVHENYLQDNLYSDIDESRKKFDKLRPDLQESNRQQILYAAEILATEGYCVVPVEGSGEPPSPQFTPEETERMAILEHGRWNSERLASKWKYGPKKDVKNKITPWLVAWDELPDYMKEYDIKAIGNYVTVLAKAGLKVVRKSR